MAEPAQNPEALRRALEGILDGDRILDRPIDRVAFAGDASFYRKRSAGSLPSAVPSTSP